MKVINREWERHREHGQVITDRRAGSREEMNWSF